MIAAEATAVNQSLAELERDIDHFRALILKCAPFGVPGGGNEPTENSVNEAFAALNSIDSGTFGTAASLQDLFTRLKEAKRCCFLLGLADIGDLEQKLERCKSELSALRLLWEEAAAVLDSVSSCTALPWASVDVDSVAEECKKKMKDLRALPRIVRDFEAYRCLEDKLKGITTVLPLLRDLAHPAMRPRHWVALAQALGARLPSDNSKLTLGMLVALRLDQYSDTCTEVVDTAKKEAVIEKALAKMAAAWQVLKLGFSVDPCRFDAVPSLLVDETVTEALESDMTALQNMAASKIVAGNVDFRTAVMTWQRRLRDVDGVLSVWTDVQRKWSSLESIFCNSADIRAQLPEEASAFDIVNDQFKVIITIVLLRYFVVRKYRQTLLFGQ